MNKYLTKAVTLVVVGISALPLSYQSASGQPFTEISTSLPAILTGSVAWGDFDNDNNMDVLVAGFDPFLVPECKVFRNVGGGNFFDLGINLPPIRSGFAAWVDYNNDGFLDVFLTGETTNSGQITKIFRNEGGNSFVDAQANLPQGYIHDFAAWGDFDNDGDLDFLAGFGELFRNDGNNRFTKISPGWSSFLDSCGDLVDFDNDGDLDVLLAGLYDVSSSQVVSQIFRNDGDCIFTNVGANLPGLRHGNITWGDYDRDGKPDLFLCGPTNYQLSEVTSKVFHNDGDGVFHDSGFVLPPIQYGSARWLDYDNDGYQDLFLVTDYLKAQIYQNLSGTSLTNSGIEFNISQSGRIAWDWCDYDRDGDLDLYLSAVSNSVTPKIKRNDGAIANLQPAVPAGLHATVSGKSVTLNWNAASDANQSGGLTYNLRLGTSPGGVDVVSPSSDPNTGFRRIPRSGNVQHNLSWAIRNLAVGTYYWSVQAVDSSFEGSPFAAEGIFSVTLVFTNPSVVTDPATQISRFEATANGLVYPNGLDTTVYFEFGIDTHYGSVTPSQQLPANLIVTNISSQLNSLVQGTIYHFRAIATNSAGVAYGRDQIFQTQNYSPSISSIADMKFAVLQLSISTNLVISDSESPADQLVLAGFSSNTNFVRDEDIMFSGTGSNRTLTVTRTANQFGPATITITVTDLQGGATSDTFVLNVEYFTPTVTLGNGGDTAAFGDYDNDGDLDVLKESSGNILYRNNGNQTFSNVPPSFAIQNGSLAWGDYDNDGDLDFLRTGRNQFSGYVSRIYRNGGSGAFTTNTLAGLLNVGFGSASFGDFDNDGRLDILLTGSTNNTGPAGGDICRIYRNNGDQTFSNVVSGLTGVEQSSVAWGDYDNDGRLDFVISGGTFSVLKNISRVYHNNGDNTFTDIAAGLPGLVTSSVAWGDYDNDGYLDILLAGTIGSYNSGVGVVRVFHNNGNGTFTDAFAGLPDVPDNSVAWGDINNDGYLDILTSGSGLSRVYVNNRNGTFSDLAAGLSGLYHGFAGFGDIDSDGDLDILLVWDGVNRIYRNNTTTSNTPPTTPTNLAATILPHNNVILTWNPSTDSETTNSKGLYYNLRLGTNSGGIQLFSPQADLATGLRRLPAFGNTGHTNQWLVSNLPKGDYYWSVQAIDTSFAGSPFAIEATFTITNDVDMVSNHAPVADPQSLSVSEDTSLPITLTGSDTDGDALTYAVIQPPTNGILRGVAPNLTYVPKTNYFGTDGFRFRVRDGLATSSTVDIAITVAPVQDVAELRLSQSMASDFSFITLSIFGEPYQGYAFEASTNIVNWVTLYSFTSSIPGVGYSVSSSGYPRRFFRVRTLP